MMFLRGRGIGARNVIWSSVTRSVRLGSAACRRASSAGPAAISSSMDAGKLASGNSATLPSCSMLMRSRFRYRQVTRCMGRLWQIEEQNFGRIPGCNAQCYFVLNARAVAGREFLAIERERAARDLHPGAPAGTQRVCHFSILEPRGVETRVLTDGHGTIAPVG